MGLLTPTLPAISEAPGLRTIRCRARRWVSRDNFPVYRAGIVIRPSPSGFLSSPESIKIILKRVWLKRILFVLTNQLAVYRGEMT